eukprot:11465290-Alexandrium_andersonii.AAC.1
MAPGWPTAKIPVSGMGEISINSDEAPVEDPVVPNLGPGQRPRGPLPAELALKVDVASSRVKSRRLMGPRQRVGLSQQRILPSRYQSLPIDIPGDRRVQHRHQCAKRNADFQ